MKRGLLILIIILACTGGGIGYYILSRQPQRSYYSSSKQGISFTYPKTAKLEEDSSTKGRIVRVSNREGEVDYSIAVDYEEGLAVAANALKKSVLDLTLDNANRTLPKIYPKYQELSRSRYNHAGHQAGELKFNYMSQNEPVTARFIVIVVNDSKALYIRAQSKSEAFELLDKTTFKPFIQAFSLK